MCIAGSFLVTVLFVAVFGIAPAFSQVPEARISPHEQISATIAGKEIQITYGRPYARGRRIFGHGLSYGKL